MEQTIKNPNIVDYGKVKPISRMKLSQILHKKMVALKKRNFIRSKISSVISSIKILIIP